MPSLNLPVFESRWRAVGVEVPLSFVLDKETHQVRVRRAGEGWLIVYAGSQIHISVVAIRASELVLAYDGGAIERFRIARDKAGELLLSWRGAAYRLARPTPLSADSLGRSGHGYDGASLSAPMPGTLIKVLVSEGEAVSEGQPLLVLEAMKMEHTVVAPYAGTVRSLPFTAGSSVSSGANLIELVPTA